MRVDGKTWVVTGAGNGMGREVTRQMLARGARVAAVDLSSEALAETAALARAGERLSTHVLDVTDRTGVAALPAAVVAAHGVVDGLLNNAGIIQPFVPVAELDDAAIRRVMDVNFTGTLELTRAFLPLLLERPEGHIANVSSMGGFFPFPGQTVYGASKAAVKLFTEGLYVELLGSGVRVSVIMPGAVDTAITAHSGVESPTGPADADSSRLPMTSADKAARIMLDGIEKDRLHIYVGRDAVLMSVAIKLAPRRAITLVKKAMDRRLQQSPTTVAGRP